MGGVLATCWWRSRPALVVTVGRGGSAFVTAGLRFVDYEPTWSVGTRRVVAVFRMRRRRLMRTLRRAGGSFFVAK